MAIQPTDNASIDAQRTIFQEIFYFGQYRDDCITIGTGDADQMDLLLEFLNSLDENLKFTVEIGGISCYLDWKITIDDKKILISVYSKPTDSHLYLHGTSCHPARSIDAISIGVAKRLKRIYSNDSNFLEQWKRYSACLA